MRHRMASLAAGTCLLVALGGSKAQEAGLQRSIDDLIAEIRRLRSLTDQEAAALDAKVVELAARLTGADEVWAARLHVLWGQMLGNRFGRHDEAERAYRRGEPILARMGRIGRIMLAKIDMNRATLLSGAGWHDEALRDFERIEGVLRELKLGPDLVVIYVNRTVPLKAMGRYVEALQDCDRAEELLRRRPDELLRAEVDLAKGGVYLALGRFEDAIEDLARAEAVFLARGNRARLALALAGRAEALRFLRRFEEALPFYEKAERHCREERGWRDAAFVTIARAATLKELGRIEEALTVLEEAEQLIRREAHSAARPLFLTTRARVRMLLDDENAAMNDYRRAAELLKGRPPGYELAEISAGIAAIRERQGEFAEALAEYERSAGFLGSVLSSGIQPSGEQSSWAFRMPLRAMLSRVLGCLARLDQPALHQLAAAYQVAQMFHALGMVELLADRGRPPAAGVPAVPRRAAQEEAARALQEAEGRWFLESLLPPAETLEGRRDQERSLQEARSAVERHRQRLDQVVEQLRLVDPARAALRYPRVARPDEIQAVLPPGGALLEYAFSEDLVYVFVMTRGSATAVNLGPSAPIAQAAGRAAAALAAPADPQRGGDTRALLADLGRRILRPALDALPAGEEVHTLRIAPDGELCRFPFEALILGDGAGKGRFLVEDFSVAYVPSGTAFREQVLLGREGTTREPGPRSLIAFAYPGPPATAPESASPIGLFRGGLHPLPGTMEEVLRLAGSFVDSEAEREEVRRALGDAGDLEEARTIQGRRFALFLGPAAGEAALKRRPEVRKADVLHLACHGRADLASPALSHLVLAPGDGDDGFVGLREIRDLDLRAELVVLSACETGAGPLRPMEGVLGMWRATFAAGARSVLATLWKVPDRSARDLVLAFYRLWLEGGRSRAEALSGAKREAIRSGLPVKAWSAWVLWDAGP